MECNNSITHNGPKLGNIFNQMVKQNITIKTILNVLKRYPIFEVDLCLTTYSCHIFYCIKSSVKCQTILVVTAVAFLQEIAMYRKVFHTVVGTTTAR